MKTVVITGASRGIGKALTEKFLANGDEVIGTSTTSNANFKHARLTFLKLDLSKPESIEDCADKLIAFNKKIDVLINNAGALFESDENFINVGMEELRKTLEVDLIGVVHFTERVVPLVKPGGHIINISSRAGSLEYTTQYKNHPSYKIAKAGLNMFSRILAVNLQGKAIVSAVHPGWVKTDMGGDEAELSPQESAEYIFNLAHNSNLETGQFWYKNQKFPW